MSGARDGCPAFSLLDLILIAAGAVVVVTVAAFAGWL